MSTIKNSGFTISLSLIKDLFYIFAILGGILSFIITKIKNDTIVETMVKQNTENIKKINNILDEQVDMNEKFMIYIESHKEK